MSQKRHDKEKMLDELEYVEQSVRTRLDKINSHLTEMESQVDFHLSTVSSRPLAVFDEVSDEMTLFQQRLVDMGHELDSLGTVLVRNEGMLQLGAGGVSGWARQLTEHYKRKSSLKAKLDKALMEIEAIECQQKCERLLQLGQPTCSNVSTAVEKLEPKVQAVDISQKEAIAMSLKKSKRKAAIVQPKVGQKQQKGQCKAKILRETETKATRPFTEVRTMVEKLEKMQKNTEKDTVESEQVALIAKMNSMASWAMEQRNKFNYAAPISVYPKQLNCQMDELQQKKETIFLRRAEIMQLNEKATAFLVKLQLPVLANSQMGMTKNWDALLSAVTNQVDTFEKVKKMVFHLEEAEQRAKSEIVNLNTAINLFRKNVTSFSDLASLKQPLSALGPEIDKNFAILNQIEHEMGGGSGETKKRRSELEALKTDLSELMAEFNTALAQQLSSIADRPSRQQRSGVRNRSSSEHSPVIGSFSYVSAPSTAGDPRLPKGRGRSVGGNRKK